MAVEEHTFACEGGPFDGEVVSLAVDITRDYELRLTSESRLEETNVYRPAPCYPALDCDGNIPVVFVNAIHTPVAPPSIFDED